MIRLLYLDHVTANHRCSSPKWNIKVLLLSLCYITGVMDRIFSDRLCMSSCSSWRKYAFCREYSSKAEVVTCCQATSVAMHATLVDTINYELCSIMQPIQYFYTVYLLYVINDLNVLISAKLKKKKKTEDKRLEHFCVAQMCIFFSQIGTNLKSVH